MKKDFSVSWKSSKQPRKQRKYRYNAPLHIKQKFMKSHLSKELRKKYSKRAAILRKGDNVKIIKGQFKGKTGKVDFITIKKGFVYVTGVEVIKKDGSKANYPLNPSNIIITELNIDDKKRVKSIQRR